MKLWEGPRVVSDGGLLNRLLPLYCSQVIYTGFSRLSSWLDVAKYSVKQNVWPRCAPIIDLNPQRRSFIYLKPFQGIHHGALSYYMQNFHDWIYGAKRVTLFYKMLGEFWITSPVFKIPGMFAKPSTERTSCLSYIGHVTVRASKFVNPWFSETIILSWGFSVTKESFNSILCFKGNLNVGLLKNFCDVSDFFTNIRKRTVLIVGLLWCCVLCQTESWMYGRSDD